MFICSSSKSGDFAQRGGPGSTKAHNEILDLIDRSNSYDEFKIKIIKWSENRLEGGSSSLPKGL